MKMFSTQNDGEQITKLNSRVTDLHDAYRVLLQNVNRLQKDLDEKCSKKGLFDVAGQVDYVENEQQRLEEKIIDINTKVVDDYKELDWRLEKIEDKTLAEVKAEATSTNPGEVYLQAKDKVLAAMDHLLDTDVGHFEFSSRAMNCFWVRHITTMRNLISFSEKSLLQTKNLGFKTLIEIKSVLAKYDLKLREEGDFDELDELQEKLKHEND